MSAVYTHPRLTQLTVVAAVLAASAASAFSPSILWPAALVGAVGVGLLLRWPNLGLAILPLVGLLVPFSIGTGTETNLNASVLLIAGLLGLWLLHGLLTPGRTEPLGRPVIPLALLIVVAILALVAGIQPWLPFASTASLASQLGGLSLFILSAGAFMLTAYRIDDLRWLEAMTWAFVAAGAILVASRLVGPLGQLTNRFFQSGSDGSMFWIWLAAMSFGQALLNQKLRPLWRLTLLGVTLGSTYWGIVLARDWISGWLPALIAIAATYFLAKPRSGTLLAVVGALAISQGALGLMSAITDQGNTYSLDTRVAAWQTLGQVISASPLIGLGPANYYFYTPLFSILGYNVRFNSHNNYVDIIAQTGLLGFACFLWFALMVFVVGLRLRTRVPAGFERAYVSGAVGGLVGMLAAGMFGDWFLPFVYNIGLAGFRASILGWLFLGGLVSLEQTVHDRAQDELEAS